MASLPAINTLFYDDNLDILRDCIPDDSVDLIYLDPPFNSNAIYNAFFRTPTGEQSKAQVEAFRDKWHWNEASEKVFYDITNSGQPQAVNTIKFLRVILKQSNTMAYIVMMAIRLIELHRVLKPTGSLYLHCDQRINYYLKILLNGIFGDLNFRNEIAWKRTSSHGGARRWGPCHDTILFYSKSCDYKWREKYKTKNHTIKNYKFEDKNGLFRIKSLVAPGIENGKAGQSWRGFDPTSISKHWNVPRVALERIHLDYNYDILDIHQKLDYLDASGLIFWPSKANEFPKQKCYANAVFESEFEDVILDIKALASNSRERLGYPTQKPIALLERIISASSDEGDIILDPFCGCGTTIYAAQNLSRRWLGIDLTHLAIDLIQRRLNDIYAGTQFNVVGAPRDIAGARALAEQDKHQFQLWAISVIKATPFTNIKKGADGGVDGCVYFKSDQGNTEKAILSVKGGRNLSLSMIRELIGTLELECAKIGVFITLDEPTANMRATAAAAGFYATEHGIFPRIQILTVAELLAGKRPRIPQWLMSDSAETLNTKNQKANQVEIDYEK